MVVWTGRQSAAERDLALGVALVGGALTDTTIIRTFLDLAGGADAPIVVIPTAGEDDHYDSSYRGLEQFAALGGIDQIISQQTSQLLLRHYADKLNLTIPQAVAVGALAVPCGRAAGNRTYMSAGAENPGAVRGISTWPIPSSTACAQACTGPPPP